MERTTIDGTLKFLSSPHSAFISFNASFFSCRLLTTKFRIFTIQSTHHTIERVIECVRAMDVKSLNENINEEM
jgi:hypothetical protein